MDHPPAAAVDWLPTLLSQSAEQSRASASAPDVWSSLLLAVGDGHGSRAAATGTAASAE